MYYRFVSIIIIQFLINGVKSKEADCAITNKEQIDPFAVYFYVCTNTAGDCAEVSETDVTADFLEERGFDPQEETYVLTHGFWRNHMEDWVQKMYRLLLKRGNPNVILVNWSAISRRSIFTDWRTIFRFMDYKTPVIATQYAASAIGSFLRNVSDVSGTPLKKWHKLHFIGHSLGAHVSGQAARNLKDDMEVHRVTGLDPAGPCFEGLDTKLKLSHSDAKFVDAIHTNSDSGENLNFGIHEAVATVDFYPNGGNYNPECMAKGGIPSPSGIFQGIKNAIMDVIVSISMSMEKILFDPTVDMKDMALTILTRRSELICEHYMAPEYFSRSLEEGSEKIMAVPKKKGELYDDDKVKCDIANCASDTCIELGINADKYTKAKGSYWASTSEGDPKC
ncbi:hypothetical protein QAD02_011285 [Eretmocerus hayati]|uniref:Uncharacterized protein n=1 Tax=Eretmocerus hayati TaxID=131215 RepID=A0ACC2NYX4_9HYME|nr:hypothetical protein QAD02_011285 [Eretmocerus hayati]